MLVLAQILRNQPLWSLMKILFTFENTLPSSEADAEVFMTTARYLAPLTSRSWLHLPAAHGASDVDVGTPSGMSIIQACAPVRPAVLRHFFCGLSLILRKEFHQADLVYTRNLWVAWLAVRFGQRVVFDHYRPWSDQIPPLQPWIRALICDDRFLINICHSDYTRRKYRELGIPEEKLRCIHNGFEPQRLQPYLSVEAAKAKIGISADSKTIVYTGRINHKKGLSLLVEAARRLPDYLFILVGSYGEGSIETMTSSISNIRIVPWQPPETLGQYIFAADVLLIPPSWRPLAEFGSTVLPLKLFFYMASGRPILAGDTPDVRELLRHGENAFLCRPDCPDSLTAGIRMLMSDRKLASRLADTALSDSSGLTWDARAHKIADAITERLQSAPLPCSVWSGIQIRSWLRQSRHWLVHLVVRRSWILPPNAVLSSACASPFESQ